MCLKVGFFSRNSNVSLSVQFNVSSDEFQVKDGDHIGWTGFDNNRYISRDDDSSNPRCHDCTRVRSDLLFLPLRVRVEPYTHFEWSPRQFVFSAAVKIYRRKYAVVLLSFRITL